MPDNSVKSAYVNAFAEYLQGIFLLHAGDSYDHEVGRTALRSTALDDGQRATCGRMWNGLSKPARSDGEPMTYVIFESGIAPRREEVRIDIPVCFFNLAATDTGVDYIGVAFPRLVPQPGGVGQAACFERNDQLPDAGAGGHGWRDRTRVQG